MATGNPNPVGGIYRTADAPGTALDRLEFVTDSRGRQVVAIGVFDGSAGAAATVDIPSNPGDARTLGRTMSTVANSSLFNRTNWDREEANLNVTLLASAARTAETPSADQTNFSNRCVHIFTDVTAIVDTPILTVTIEGKDALSGKYYTILAGSNLSSITTQVLTVCPGMPNTAGVSQSDSLPRTWRVNVTVADADSATYSIGASITR